jgi:S-adenosylmethionine hydrolase
MPMAEQQVVTFTTDFGLSDHFVGTMKGVVLNVNPAAQMVDISNAVQSFDVLDGALTIAQAYSYFPADTVHLVIVDPGVGTQRRPIVVRAGKHYFVAPDNGVLSFVYEREDRVKVWKIDAEHYYLRPVCSTFHGRDIFAPVAGHLSKGVEASKFGQEIADYVRLAPPRPKLMSDKSCKGVVLKVDKFGNLVTNILPRDVPQLFQQAPSAFRLKVGNAQVTNLRTAYAQGPPGEVFAIVGSMGFLEIAANRGAAARIAGADKGSEVELTLE